MAICHQTGHALYQQGLPTGWREQPVGEALGAAVHESQSLLMELQVCRSRGFIEHMAPTIRQCFQRDSDDPAWSADNLYQHAIRVERGFIRVDADEVSYPLHVILRFELERQLLDGALPVSDLPEAWNAAMQRYLNLSTTGNDANGCMQDVHWYAGLFGYFPTYTLTPSALSAQPSGLRQPGRLCRQSRPALPVAIYSRYLNGCAQMFMDAAARPLCSRFSRKSPAPGWTPVSTNATSKHAT